MKKVCKKCGAERPLIEFPKHPGCSDGHKGTCKVCTYAAQKARVKKDGNKNTKAYRKRPSGYIMQTYSNMFGRVSGKIKPHLYAGKDILPKEDFYLWANNPENGFMELFEKYVETGFDQRFAPSIDRIDTSKGYIIGNIRWITHSLNSSLGAKNK